MRLESAVPKMGDGFSTHLVTPSGSSLRVLFVASMQVNHTQAVVCEPCPAGHYCVLAGQSVVCPIGYYCPPGTGLNWQACPRGTFSDVEALYSEAQCKPCPGGDYCGGEHLSAPSGKPVN